MLGLKLPTDNCISLAYNQKIYKTKYFYNDSALNRNHMMVLQQWYGLSDLEAERQIADRISFRGFLGFPNPIPDSRTIWLFRERMAETGKDMVVWAEFQRQLDAKGLQVKRGTIQDATFIEADPGPFKKLRGGDSKTRRSRDGTWAKKGNETHFEYKLHSNVDVDYSLIREIETTTASLHDSQVDLSTKDEVILRDRRYFGAPTKGNDFTMKRRPQNILFMNSIKSTID